MFVTFGINLNANTNFKDKGIIFGTVVDSLTKQEMQYATITIMKQMDSSVVSGTITDKKGNFKIENLSPENYLCKVSFIGYEKTFIRNINMTKENPIINLGKIVLLPAEEMKSEVLVTAEKDPISYQVDKKIINVGQILGSKGGNVLEILKQIPSINVDIDGNVTMRGSGNFQVLVDGRPTLMSASDIFRQIPSEMIESIEIITNPSAKYDPDGTSGIINIIMVKEKNLGYNGMVSTSLGTRDKYNGSVQMNIRNSYYGFLIVADYINNNYHPHSDVTRETYYGLDTVLYARTTMNRRMNPDNYKFKLGGDLNITDFDLSSLTLEYTNYTFERIFPGNMHYWSKPEYENYSAINNDLMTYGGKLFQGTLNYQHKFEPKDNNIQATLIHAIFDGGFNGDTEYFWSDSNVVLVNRTYPDKKRSDLDELKNQSRLSVDYLKAFENSKLELGSLTDLKFNESSFLYQSFMQDRQIWLTDFDLTNKFKYSHLIQGIYGTYSSEIFGFEYQLGLRLEYYKRNLEQLTLDKSYQYEKFSVFPTFHLTRQIANGQQLQFSYSRRVQRPHDRTLNPFPDYVDNIFISTGNPNLKPEYTNSFELNYRYGFGQSFAALETYFRQTDDLMTQFQTLREDGKILLTTDNMNTNYVYGLELSGSLAFFQWLRVNGNVNYYAYTLEEKKNEKFITNTKNVFSTNLNTTFIITPNTFLQINCNYRGPSLTANGEMAENYSIGATIKQDFLEKKLSISLQAQDIFGTSKYQFYSYANGFKSYGEFLPERQVVTLNITYLINDFNRQTPKSKSLDLEYQSGF